MPDQSLILHDPAEGAVSLLPGALEQKSLILQECALIGRVKNEAQQAVLVAAWQKLKSWRANLEKARIELNKPHLERQREINGIARLQDDAMKLENDRLDAILTEFQEAQREKVRQAELARQAELRRIEEEKQAELRRIEAERKALEDAARKERERIEREAAEARRKAQEAEAEAQRKAAEATAGLRKEDREAAEAKARKEAEERRLAAEAEQARLAQEKSALDEKERLAAVERQRQLDRENELAALRTQVAGPVARSAQAKGQTSRIELDFEVFDIHLLYRHNPGFVTLKENRAEIKGSIANGLRDIAGVRIFEVNKNKIRAAKILPAIDVETTVSSAPTQADFLSQTPS